MFTQLKERFAEKLRNLGPQDELDRYIITLLERGSAEDLHSPNWEYNMTLVDIVNRQPEVASEKLCRHVNRIIAKPVVRSQVLVLTMLDTCVRNCHPILHSTLVQSVLWADLIKLVQDTSVTRIDLEVRDRILNMIEDYGQHIHNIPAYSETYESLVDLGVDFPVRSAEDIQPWEPYIPPVPVSTSPTTLPVNPNMEAPLLAQADHDASGPATAAPATAGATAAAAASAAAATANRFFNNIMAALKSDKEPSAAAHETSAQQGEEDVNQQQQRAHRSRQRAAAAAPIDPAILQGMSDEDRAAVEAAMADMATDVEAAQEAAAIAASLRDAAAAGGGDEAQAGQGGQERAPEPLPEDNEAALQVISSSVGLFSEMVGGVPDDEPQQVQDAIIRELAGTCGAYRSRLAQMAGDLADEAQLVQALALNDQLGVALARYDGLLARAMSQAPVAPTGPDTDIDTAARAAAATQAIIAGGAAPPTSLPAPGVGPGSAGGAFTLADDEEEDSGLVTTRTQPVPTSTPSTTVDLLGDMAVPAEQPAAQQQAPAPPATTASPAHDLI